MNRVLIYSPAFLPSVGGLEAMCAIVGRGLTALGYQVTLVTTTPSSSKDEYAFEVVRNPRHMQLVQLIRAADVVLQMNVSLKGIWPLLFVHRPVVIAHQGVYQGPNGRMRWRDHLKVFIARRAVNICCSEAVAQALPIQSPVVRNG